MNCKCCNDEIIYDEPCSCAFEQCCGFCNEPDYQNSSFFIGEKIKFTASGGYDKEIFLSKSILTINEIYTIKYIEIHDWYSYVTLSEFPNMKFNIYLFDKYVKSNA